MIPNTLWMDDAPEPAQPDWETGLGTRRVAVRGTRQPVTELPSGRYVCARCGLTRATKPDRATTLCADCTATDRHDQAVAALNETEPALPPDLAVLLDANNVIPGDVRYWMRAIPAYRRDPMHRGHVQEYLLDLTRHAEQKAAAS